MKNLIPIFLLVFFLIVAQLSSGQTAEEIIEKYVDALGGKDKLDAIRSICMEGSQDYYGKAELIKITVERGKLKRFDIEVDGKKGYWMVTEKLAGEYYPWKETGKIQFPDSVVKSLQPNLDISNRLVNYQARGEIIQLTGKELLDDKECYKLLVTTKTGKTLFYWIDVSTRLLTQVERSYSFYDAKKEQTFVKEITSYKNYRPVEGVMFAFTEVVDTFIKGEKVASKASYYNNIEVNKPVDPRLYKL